MTFSPQRPMELNILIKTLWTISFQKHFKTFLTHQFSFNYIKFYKWSRWGLCCCWFRVWNIHSNSFIRLLKESAKASFWSLIIFERKQKGQKSLMFLIQEVLGYCSWNFEFHRSPTVKLQLFAPTGNAKEQESRSSSVPKISLLFFPTRGYFYVLAS